MNCVCLCNAVGGFYVGGRKGISQALLDTRLSTPVPSRRLLWSWLVLLALSQLADLLTTWWSLASGHHEANPFVAAALGSGSFPLYALVKALLVVALGIAVLGGRPVALHGTRLVVAVFSAVALANLVAALLS
jgi:hypothetical protein